MFDNDCIDFLIRDPECIHMCGHWSTIIFQEKGLKVSGQLMHSCSMYWVYY